MLKSYSFSSLEAFDECPRKFKFERIEKAPVAERVAAHIYLGNAIHTILAHLYEASSQGRVLSLETALDEYRAEWEKPTRSAIVCMDESLTVDDYIQSGGEILTRYYQKYQPFGGGTLLAVEKTIPFTIDNTPFKFNARIDRLWKRPDGTTEIWDYKTGKELPRKSDHRYRMQMGLYHLAVRQNWPQFEKVEVVQHAVRQDEIIRDSISSDELDEIAERFKVKIFETLAAEKTDDYPTREGHHCRWCDYLALCPAKVHKRFIEGEESRLQSVAATASLAAELADRYLKAVSDANAADHEKERLRAEVIEAARELGVSKLAGANGDVSVRLRVQDEFPTKSGDRTAFAELSALVRDAGLDTMFTLDQKALMKLFEQRRMPDDLYERLQSFLIRKDRPLVTVPRKKKELEEDDSEVVD